MADNASLSDVYLDSSLVVAATIAGIPHSDACTAFCSRLIADNSHIFFSQILRLEIAEAVRKLATRAQLPEDIRQEYQLRPHDTPTMDGLWYGAIRLIYREISSGIGTTIPHTDVASKRSDHGPVCPRFS